MRLQDKVAIVTGASKGIGEAISYGFARAGAKVVLAARSADLLEEVARNIRSEGGEALAIPTDVTVEDDVIAMVQAAHAHFGHIDTLVNNAGGGMWRHVWRTSMETWQWLMGVNLTGPFLCIKHVWRIMEDAGGGSIINIGSTSGSRAFPLMAAYSASKWGLVGLTKSCAAEGGPLGIRVNCINPGKVATGFRAAAGDTEPILDAEDCVGLTLFLASDEARHVHGQVIEIDHAPLEIAPGKGRRKRVAEAAKG